MSSALNFNFNIMFEIPIKFLIVNSDEQVQCLNGADGTPYADGDIATDGTGSFTLRGFMDALMNEDNLVGDKDTQLRYIARAAQTQGVGTFTVTATSADVDASFTVELVSVDKGDVLVGQQKRYFKRYQIKEFGGLDSTTDIATAIRNAISADDHAEVVASGAGADVILTPKAGVSIVDPKLYSGEIAGTMVATTPANVGNGNYENLINDEWNVKGKDYYQNIEELPVKGVEYGQWDFTVTGTSLIAGYGGQVPGVANASGNYNFRLYVATGTALHAALVLVDGDLAARV